MTFELRFSICGQFAARLLCAVALLGGIRTAFAQESVVTGHGDESLLSRVAPTLAKASPQTDFSVVPTCQNCQNGCGYSLGETLYKSLIGPQPDPERTWTPLTLVDFGEGWFDPWIAPPGGPGGSRRQGWVGSNDAFFNRMIVGIYSHTQADAGKPDSNVGALLFETPLTRRYMFGVFLPFVQALEGGPSSVGDTTFENRFMLHETETTTVTFNFNVITPTGDTALGGNRTALTQYLALYRDIGNGFSLRGISGIEVPVDDRSDGVDSTFIWQAGVGQTLTDHDVPLFGDFTYSLMTNVRKPNGAGDTYVALTPGLRTHLGKNFFLLAGYDIPVSSPEPFENRFNLVLVKGY